VSAGRQLFILALARLHERVNMCDFIKVSRLSQVCSHDSLSQNDTYKVDVKSESMS
jgi:hypothetical protein